MRKPTLILDLDKKIESFIIRERRLKRRKLITYILKRLEADKGLNTDTMSHSLEYEKAENYSIEILTLRINGQIMMREFPYGSISYGLTGRRYEIYIDKYLQD